ncbi:MAG: endonuclease/exonuclease/phosphatase family protein [Chthoniobacterales bacterium]
MSDRIVRFPPALRPSGAANHANLHRQVRRRPSPGAHAALALASGSHYGERMATTAPGPPPVIDSPPRDVEAMLAALRAGLDDPHAGVPPKRPGNLLIGTWNVRAFGGITQKWTSGQDDSPKRNLADVCAIAEVVSRFDVTAIQETRENLLGLRTMMSRLGEDWSFIVTDVGDGGPANGERLAFVHQRSRVKSSGLAGELVFPQEWFGDVDRGKLERQFARTPYAVSFAAGDEAFTLVTLHVLFGDSPEDRTPELAAIAHWLGERAHKGGDFNHNMLALGDFNIDRQDDPNWIAFTENGKGLTPPPELNFLSRTIFDDEKKESTFFDQIAWFTREGREQLTLRYNGSAGRFKWTDYWLRDMPKTPKSWRLSDHYPLWCEFELGARRRFRR